MMSGVLLPAGKLSGGPTEVVLWFPDECLLGKLSGGRWEVVGGSCLNEVATPEVVNGSCKTFFYQVTISVSRDRAFY